MTITKSTACNHDTADYYLQSQSSKTSSTPILRWTEEIDLGVVFDTKLSFRNHINMSINKANRLLGIIRSFCALDDTSFALLYKAIVRPHLEYAATIWNPYKKGNIDDLEKVQRRATKVLQNISHLSYPERQAALSLPTLAYRRSRGDMMVSFRNLNNIYDSRVTHFLSKSNFSTTSSCLYNMQTSTSKVVLHNNNNNNGYS